MWLLCELPICKQIHLNGPHLTTTSAIIDLTIIAVLRKDLQHGDCANRHVLRVVTRRPFFRALNLSVNSQRTGETTRGTKRSGSATFGGHRNQPPSPISISSPNLRYISLIYLSLVFKNGTFACTFQSLNVSSVSILDMYIYIYIYIYTKWPFNA